MVGSWNILERFAPVFLDNFFADFLQKLQIKKLSPKIKPKKKKKINKKNRI